MFGDMPERNSMLAPTLFKHLSIPVTKTEGWSKVAHPVTERGWFPRAVPPADGLRAVHCLGQNRIGVAEIIDN
jgi:hypothetical protein